MRIVTSVSSISFRALGVIATVVLLLSFVIMRHTIQSTTLQVVLVILSVWLITRPSFIIPLHRSEVIQRASAAIKLLTLPSQVEGDRITLTIPGTVVRLKGIGGWTIMSFHFSDPKSKKEQFVKKTLIKYQRSSLN